MICVVVAKVYCKLQKGGNPRNAANYNCNHELSSGMAHSNIIRVATDKYDRGLHDAQKPIRLLKLLIELVTRPNDLVLDPFAGSGTTCAAAKSLHRHYIGIEIDAKAGRAAMDRLAGVRPSVFPGVPHHPCLLDDAAIL